MASSSYSLLLVVNSYTYTLFILLAFTNYVMGCYTSLFGFGDSLTDTGNLVGMSPPDNAPPFAFPPYGETFFHYPTGRCSDGRLIIDFIAEYYGLPLIPPYAEAKKTNISNFRQGVNFAVVGSPALDTAFYDEREIINPVTNYSMRDQLRWFKELLPSLCHTSSGCSEFLENSLFLLGAFGGNDYTHSMLLEEPRISIDEVQSFVPLIVQAIGEAIKELIDVGAKTLIVPGIMPLGCMGSYLTFFQVSNKAEYDEMGCLIWLNKFTHNHNELLQREINQLRELHPGASIIYADYQNAAMEIYRSPEKHGFYGGALVACCGAGGPYNFNSSIHCGEYPWMACDNPSSYVDWDGYHLTEAAYKQISTRLLEGPYTIPSIDVPCSSRAVRSE